MKLAGAIALAWVGVGCGPAADPNNPCAGTPASDTIACVLSFSPGDAGGFGESKFPDIVFGEPKGAGELSGSLDVVALGRFGSIEVGFGDRAFQDNPGPELIVFENAFFKGGDPTAPFAEPGEVSVSADGETWTPFPCDPEPPYAGCAGLHPVYANPDEGISSRDPEVSGGEAFDLADIGVQEARYVQIRDIKGFGDAPLAGFDLDAIVLLESVP